MNKKAMRWIILTLLVGLMTMTAASCATETEAADGFKLAWESDIAEPMGITVHKDDTKFFEMINDTIDTMKDDGTIKEISEKWFALDVTPNLTEGGNQDVTVDESIDQAYGKDTIVVAVDDSYPPMEFVDDDGKTQLGYDIDFARAMFEAMGKEVEFESTAWDQIFNGLNARSYDAIISAVSITDERMDTFLQSKPYVANKVVLLTRSDFEDITDLDELEGMKIAVQAATTADDLITEVTDGGVDIEVSRYDVVTQCLMELEQSRVDAVLVDSVVAGYYIVQNSAE